MVEITPFMRALTAAQQKRCEDLRSSDPEGCFDRAGDAASMVADVNANHASFGVMIPGSDLEKDVNAILADLEKRLPAGVVPPIIVKPTGSHLVDGEFQSDKYPETPRGFVPLKLTDPMAQDLLWKYAERRREVDSQFSNDLQQALRLRGYKQPAEIGCPACRVIREAGTAPPGTEHTCGRS